MDPGLRVVLGFIVLFVVLDGALVLAWIRADRKRARERREILDALER